MNFSNFSYHSNNIILYERRRRRIKTTTNLFDLTIKHNIYIRNNVTRCWNVKLPKM